MNKFKIIYLLAVLLVVGTTACNKDKDKDDDSVYVYTTSSSSTLVSRFSLQANTDVMTGLDSVFFTIDPERNLIYNADSLPVGTKVDALKVSMAFNSSVGSAIFHIYDQDRDVTDYEYSATSSEEIDFRYGVYLTITSADGLHTKEYTVKVNVHQVEPDSIAWPLSARRDLPGATDNNYELGTASLGNLYVCLLHNSDGYVLSNSYSPMGPWEQKEMTWGFEPKASSLTATDEKLYVLDVNGNLYVMNDDESWQSTGVQWETILGGYGDRVLGITAEPYCYDEYPRRDNFTPKDIASDFPIKGSSQMVLSTANWSVAPQAVIVGGATTSNALTSATWAYDGDTWAKINNSQSKLPALYGPTLFKYSTFSINESTLDKTQNETWMVMGGRLADGALNKLTYVSNNRGISWAVAANAYCMPSTIAPFHSAQAHIYTATLNASASMSPMLRAAKAGEWECPYIFLFGGYDTNDNLYNNIWQGVLLRLTFKPLL